jgi:hypothetical protein
MAAGFELTGLIEMNAYTGTEAASGRLSPDAKQWPLSNRPPEHYRLLKPPEEPDWLDWRDPRVGWGLIAPMNQGFNETQLRDNLDLPECLRRLVSEREHAPVFRYDKNWPQAYSHVHNLRDNSDISLGNTPSGRGAGCLPKYLLIWGTPEEVPWEIQFGQHGARFVGRLPLKGEELDNYVEALMNGWKKQKCNSNSPVVSCLGRRDAEPSPA